MDEVARDRVLARLIANGTPRPLATLYRDLYCEYMEAQDNIAANGAICASPRTGAPIENPYLTIRDRARAHLLKLRRVNTAGLWEASEHAGQRPALEDARQGTRAPAPPTAHRPEAPTVAPHSATNDTATSTPAAPPMRSEIRPRSIRSQTAPASPPPDHVRRPRTK